MTSENAIDVQVQLSFADIYKGTIATTLHVLRYINSVIGFLAGVSLLSLLYSMIGAPRSATAAYVGETLLPMLYVVPFVPIIVFVIPYIRARRVYVAEEMSGKRHYIFSSEGIFAETPLGNANVRWATYRYVKETRGFFYLYSQANFANIIPKRSFASESAIASFRELLKTHIAKTKLRG